MGVIVPPPPPERHREGSILEELPNTVGLVLWQDVRHLRDWVESTQEKRPELFKPQSIEVHAKRRDARAAAPELSGAIDRFAMLKAHPVAADVGAVAAGCEEVLEWALKNEFTQTAIEYAEIAALLHPSIPRRANIAGRVTRNANEYPRSETWFLRGIGIAREKGDVVEQVWGQLGYGRLCHELGRVLEARQHLNRGSRLAWKAGPPSLAASAQHDLALMLTVHGHLSEAAVHAARALQWYPKNHPRLPYFGADVALMLVLGNRFSGAARILRLVLRAVDVPSARAQILGLTARAFAGMGEAEESALYRRRAFRILAKHRAMEPVTRWHLADAQRLIGNWSAAEAEAKEALAVAIAHNDHDTERATRGLLSLVEARCRPVAKKSGTLRELVRAVITRLDAWSPRRRRSYAGPWGEHRAA